MESTAGARIVPSCRLPARGARRICARPWQTYRPLTAAFFGSEALEPSVNQP
jgi:hypothetical protein